MELAGRAIALYGRFSHGVRERLQRDIEAAGGEVARDLTRRSDLLVIGALATVLVDSGALGGRLRAARERGVPVLGERSFIEQQAGAAQTPATAPLATALGGAGLTPDDAAVLAAFDLIRIEDGACRFADAGVLRTAGELVREAGSLAEAVRILTKARDRAPRGRHRIVLKAGGGALEWQDGLTTLEGQGVLPLEGDNPTLDDLFEAAALAEAEGDLDEAAKLYDICARADRKDAIAPYNEGNIRLAQGAHHPAALAYQRALARDPRFSDARYNLAQALEGAGKLQAADAELTRLLDTDPTHADAAFNLAQLRMNAGRFADAKALYERYLQFGPPDEWADTARKAIHYCALQLRR